MKKSPRILTLFTIFLLTQAMLFAQNLTIGFNITNMERMQTLYLADLDLLQQGLEGSAESIFEVIVSALPDASSPESDYENCRMVIAIRKDGQPLATWNSESFNIPAQPEPYHLPNELLVGNSYYFDFSDNETRIVLTDAQISDVINNLQTELMTSGKLPIGSYTLEVDLNYDFNLQTNLSTNEVFPFFTATNPSYVQLLAPGGHAGSDNPIPVYNEFPVFQWNGNGSEYQVAVFEKKNQFQTVDDIINSKPNWMSEPGPELSVIYPPAGDAIPLEFGNTYYWMVSMLVQTSSGEEKINSEVWQFYLEDPTNQSDIKGVLSKNDLLNFLRDLLGDKTNEIEQSLTDYELSFVYLNSSEISILELYNLLNSYRGQGVEVIDIVLPVSNN